ncbi:MAG: ABC transporter permease [Actinobacteria bacterium]|nr:ABC transporter permease [Actinomycetota bacterium]MDA2981585.1 ABC transporter permease [Actinomycetota bacterium]MDA2996549.1 ABC transporter permease [Actinomycetota bacterium]
MTIKLNSKVTYLFKKREFGIFLFILILLAVFGTLEPRFFRSDNLSAILSSVGILMVVGAGQTLVIVTRNIDLSVGSTLGMAAMVMGMVARENPDFPIFGLIVIAMIVGGLCGLLNGLLVSYGKIPAIIATLGTLAIIRGAVFLVSDNVQIDPNDVPQGIINLATTSPIGIPWLLIFAFLSIILVWYVSSKTLLGKRIYAVGSNPEGAISRGLSFNKITIMVFVFVGVLAGLGGVLYTARYATINPADVGRGLEFDVISAVVIGGTNIFGGSGTALGTALGCILIGILSNGLTVVGVSPFWKACATGFLILAAVAIDNSVRKRQEQNFLLAIRNQRTLK